MAAKTTTLEKWDWRSDLGAFVHIAVVSNGTTLRFWVNGKERELPPTSWKHKASGFIWRMVPIKTRKVWRLGMTYVVRYKRLFGRERILSQIPTESPGQLVET